MYGTSSFPLFFIKNVLRQSIKLCKINECSATQKESGFSTHFVVFRVLTSAEFLFKNELYIKALYQQKLDGSGQHLMHSIFKIDRHWLTFYNIPPNIYLFKDNKRTTQSRRRSNVFIVNFEQNSPHCLVFPLLTLNRKIFTNIVPSFYDTIPI